MRARRARGFTMAELLTVVAMIGIIAAAAAPMVVNMTKDRRVQGAAHEVAGMYRVARARALGRGAAVLVRWNKSNPEPTVTDRHGHFSMREAVVSATNWLPQPSCQGADWAQNTTSRFVTSFDERSSIYSPATASFVDPDGTPRAFAEICFSPRGRSFVRYAAGDTFATLTGVPRVEMKNAYTAFIRQIVLVPNGAARVTGRVN